MVKAVTEIVTGCLSMNTVAIFWVWANRDSMGHVTCGKYGTLSIYKVYPLNFSKVSNKVGNKLTFIFPKNLLFFTNSQIVSCSFNKDTDWYVNGKFVIFLFYNIFKTKGLVKQCNRFVVSFEFSPMSRMVSIWAL